MRRAAAVLLLLALACAQEEAHPDVVLAEELTAMRKAIFAYRHDRSQSPQTLQDLVPRYLPAIPVDPITEKADWRVIMEEPVGALDFGVGGKAPLGGGIVDVRSAAAGHDANGKAWSDY